MKLKMNLKQKAGFSLIELMAVIAIIGILITLVSPQIGKARLRGKLTEQAIKARAIVEAITAKQASSRFSQGWPQEGEYNSSTQFLKSLVDEGYLDVEFSWFAGPGQTPARNASEFTSANNAWCIQLNLNDMAKGTAPAVYLANLNASSGQFNENKLFGSKGFAFATKNGEAISIGEGEIKNGDWSSIFVFPDGVEAGNVLKP